MRTCCITFQYHHMIPANKPLKTEPKKYIFFYHCLGLAKDYFHSLKREIQKETNRLLWAKLHIMLNHPPTPTSSLPHYDSMTPSCYFCLCTLKMEVTINTRSACEWNLITAHIRHLIENLTLLFFLIKHPEHQELAARRRKCLNDSGKFKWYIFHP